MALISLTIEYLNKCNLHCAHCAVNASPEATEKVELEDAKKWITIAKDYGAKDIYICGGEPFLVFDELCELARHTSSLGLHFTTFSNAFWALSLESAKRYIYILRENGLTSLHLSLDCFHLKEGIPLKNFLNAAEVANSIGLELIINVVQSKNKESSFNFLGKVFQDYRVRLQYGPMRAVGRAAGLDKENFIKEKKDNYKKGCRSYASPLISPKGEVFACCGAYHLASSNSPLRLGNVRDIPLSNIIEKFSNLKLLHIIATFGPYLIYELISPGKKLSINNGFSYICDFCSYLLNSEDNVKIIQIKLGNPDSELRFKLKLAEISCKNINRLKTPHFNSRLIRFCKDKLPTFWRFVIRGRNFSLGKK